MAIARKDLNFDQAREIYSAFLSGSRMAEFSQEKAFGELSIQDRQVVVRAIEVLLENKMLLESTGGGPGIPLDTTDPLLPVVVRISKGLLGHFGNQLLFQELEKSKPLAIQGRAEIVLANRFLFQGQFLKALEEDGELYQELGAICDSETLSNPQKQEDVVRAVATWVDQLDPGEGKRAAEEGLELARKMVATLTPQSGFNRANLEQLVGDFTSLVTEEVVKAWAKEPLTRNDLRAMGIGRLGLFPLMSLSSLKQKRELFEKTVLSLKAPPYQTAEAAIATFKSLEAELLPWARYPEYAVLYSRVLGAHADLIASADLKNLQNLYALYAWAMGNGEGGISVAEGLLKDGDWSINKGVQTRQEAFGLIDQAIETVERSGEKALLQKGRLVRADILKRAYVAGREFTHDERWKQVATEEFLGYVRNAYVDLGYRGIKGLYDLFLMGDPADPIIDLLSKRFKSEIKPTAADIKMLTTAALAGYEQAEKLLEMLKEKYPMIPELLVPRLLVTQGAYASPHQGQFSFVDALKCYEGALFHLENGKLPFLELDASHRRIDELEQKFANLTAEQNLPPGVDRGSVEQATAHMARARTFFDRLEVDETALEVERLPLRTPSATLSAFSVSALQVIRDEFWRLFSWFSLNRVGPSEQVRSPEEANRARIVDKLTRMAAFEVATLEKVPYFAGWTTGEFNRKDLEKDPKKVIAALLAFLSRTDKQYAAYFADFLRRIDNLIVQRKADEEGRDKELVEQEAPRALSTALSSLLFQTPDPDLAAFILRHRQNFIK